LEAWGWDISEPRRKMFRERMEALRQALAQTEQKKEWVGLTEDEFESILEQHNEAFPFVVYQSIESKLKEKK